MRTAQLPLQTNPKVLTVGSADPRHGPNDKQITHTTNALFTALSIAVVLLPLFRITLCEGKPAVT